MTNVQKFRAILEERKKLASTIQTEAVYISLLQQFNKLFKEEDTLDEMKFTVKEFENYCKSKDSYGDILYSLNKENIIKANIPSEEK